MLQELTISDLAIIDQLRLAFDPGLNVLTGETGAGKSIIIDAVSALLGARVSGDTLIRSGTARSTIEGVFGLAPREAEALQPLLREYGLDDGEGTLILGRELNRAGRNLCRVNGRAVTLGVLEEIGLRLVDIHGQGDHLSLLRVREHLLFLDRYAGLTDERARLAATVGELRQVRQALHDCLRDERELARRVDLLQFQVAEIDAAQLDPDEEQELLRQRTMLANAERLSELANSGYALLNGGEQQRRSALDTLGGVVDDLQQLERLDPGVAEQRQAVEGAVYQLEDVARALRLYRDSIEYSPSRLQQVEDRLALLQSLKRKYGETVAEVLRFGQQARQELEAISHNEERVAELRGQESALLGRAGEQGAQLSEARRQAAASLEKAVEEQLQELKMERARFVVEMQRAEDPDGPEVDGQQVALDATGIDRVEFLIAPNVGEPPKPLAKIASGGETSRLMLAMKGVLSQADAVPTLIFDEIDAGISGRVGTLVGRRLWNLTRDHQVLCVTHLPQIASFADCHLNVSKHIDGDRTVTTVRRLDDGERPHELASLLGGDGSQASLLNANELLAQVKGWKERERSPS